MAPPAASLRWESYIETLVRWSLFGLDVDAPDGQVDSVGFGRAGFTPPEERSHVPVEPLVVRQIGVDHLLISRALFDRSIDDVAGLSRLGRAVLHAEPDGTLDGYRLSAIRHGTLADQLGLENGDIVRSVAGVPLGSLADGVTAYERTRSLGAFCVGLTRSGEARELCYTLR